MELVAVELTLALGLGLARHWSISFLLWEDLGLFPSLWHLPNKKGQEIGMCSAPTSLLGMLSRHGRIQH